MTDGLTTDSFFQPLGCCIVWRGEGVLNTIGKSHSSGVISASKHSMVIDDLVEYGRGQLAGLSYRSATAARDIHIQRLRGAFDRAKIGSSLRYVLNVLSLMREVQELKGGYWIPTPPRIIPLEKSAILVSPSPTSELRRHFEGVERAGYARVLPQFEGVDLPTQSLDDWVGWGGENAKAWATAVVADAMKSMSPSVHPENLEYFSVQRRDRSMPRWNADARLAASLGNNVVFCRSRLSESYFRYFLGIVENGRLIKESNQLRDTDRLQYGVAVLLGQPITVQMGDDASGQLVRFFSALPRPERRLLLGLGVRRDSRVGKTYLLRTQEHAQIVVKMLQRLGCEIHRTDVR